ncbi:polymer-forming cytoskeletal protein [Nisaea acidiphila]|uniref:Polymer-forming cytoskeletal protein n=1 Tax=Nisaea acidiphila TaxID=1862145 RepID=A0A9J7AYK3_9PROT|nr:polymer-forming cytoskeletal protein [Nisaea acidiphila]UUX52150.1 polymer-forming cytoskeletal protein [Nisaea acidiphila]
MQPSKPSSSGFVPEIPRRTLDLPGAQSRRAAAPRGGEAKKLTVGPEISLTGEITACDSLVVEGNVDATLENSRHLEVTESGRFKGKVIIDEAVIGGKFEGTLTVRDTLTVRSTGHVTGSVRFGRLEVELGGRIEGDISVFKESDSSGPAAAE